MNNGDNNKHNYERAAMFFLGTCAGRPSKEYEKTYELMTSLYSTIAENPECIGLKSCDVNTFRPWETQKGREKDVKIIRDSVKVIDQLIDELIDCIRNSEITDGGLLIHKDKPAPKRKLSLLLNAIGIKTVKNNGCLLEMDGESAVGFKKLLSIAEKGSKFMNQNSAENITHMLFSRIVFDPNTNWSAQAFDDRIKANGNALRLYNELMSRGYIREECREGYKFSLDCYIQYGNKKEPLKYAWGEKTHGGVEFYINDILDKPYAVSVRIPSFKTVMSECNLLSDKAVKFLYDTIKDCNGCRYCVQTDKTGTKPLAGMPLGDKVKCPYYPGFSMQYRELTPEITDNILTLLDEIHSLPNFSEN